MLMLPTAVKVFIGKDPVSMKKSFDGLAAIVQQEFIKEPTNGHIFVFFNKKIDKVKLLYWDRNGYAIWYKRLEKGRFKLPRVNQKVYSINISELNLLLEGIELTNRSRLASL